ncbi:6-phosphofructokinase [[Clostridium] methylpentosum DSM 5476]|jgi:6-phosphofructokinase 1|uniref:ATP-dependent 6-phosphofructokinase n=1 Tax=[Clostridium] methylpentosum DSM 5476 TaxID=537013 RepID=C0EG36_9FIRM|nr:6-phosphofructokinase [[Clostridium] methylpentosum DSM 5476]MDY3988224.1 6-phosphofructokinase [Massilioclostridium sp.]
MEVKKIGVLTSGGDAPGMNAAVRAVVRSAMAKGIKVMGIYRGYNGLINGEVANLTIRSVSDIIQRGGTVLYTARCPEFKYEEGLRKAKKTCFDHDIDGVVVIGGDGSFRGAADLSARGVPCIGLPGTIDNDIACTDYTIGYDTAMNTAMEMVDKLRDTTMSHDRCSVVEVMGRRAGYIALNAGIACGASYIVVPEIGLDREDLMEKIKIASSSGKHHFIVMVAEGIGNVTELAKDIENTTGIESRATILGHVQRGGSPTVRDRVAASRLAYHAIELLSKGIGNRCVGFQKDDVVDYDIQEALSMKKEFPMDLYNMAHEISF